MARTVDQPATSRKPRSRVLRAIYFVLGLICLGLVYPSTVLPLVPTFDFVILAAFFFSMSSDRLHSWMLNHKVFGRIIRGYRDGGLTVRMKWVASVAIALSLGFSALVLTDHLAIRLVLLAVGVYAIWFVSSRRTRRDVPDSQPPLTA
jgi:uncharacterized protein